MILTNYDGINAAMVLNAVQSKALRILLEQLTDKQLKAASELLALDGYTITPDEMKATIHQYRIVTKKLHDALKETPNKCSHEEEAILGGGETVQ